MLKNIFRQRTILLFFLLTSFVGLTGTDTPAKAQEMNYHVYLPVIIKSPADPRYDYAGGWGSSCCQNEIDILGLKGIGWNQHYLISENGTQTFQVSEWYDENEYPKHACLWSKTTDSLVTPGDCTAWIQANPGQVWIIGNEPNLLLSEGGSQLSYQEYAELFYEASALIRAADPTAQIALADVGGGRFYEGCALDAPYTWLQNAIMNHKNRYGVPMAIDIWTIHVYNKTTPSIVEETFKIECFRQNAQTLKNMGYWTGNYQAWITEFGWYGYDEANQSYANVSQYMVDFTTWLEGRSDVTRWFWWPWGSGTALVSGGQPTALGNLYSSLAK